MLEEYTFPGCEAGDPAYMKRLNERKAAIRQNMRDKDPGDS